jgi:transcriptional regulator GlxA family with amidase domain
MQITIPLFEGFEGLDAIGPHELFGVAADAGADLTVSLCTLHETESVTASHGLCVEPDATLGDCDPDLVVVPGGGWNRGDGTGVRAAVERGDLPAALTEFAESGATIASVCTGGMVLAHAGLLDGRPATTHRGALDDLRATEATVIDARVVDDGDVLTAGGITAGLDLACHIVERAFGAEIAETACSQMEYEPSADVYVSG